MNSTTSTQVLRSIHDQGSTELCFRFEFPVPQVIENMDLHFTSTIGQIREYLRRINNMPAFRLYEQHGAIELTNDNLTVQDLGTENGYRLTILVRLR